MTCTLHGDVWCTCGAVPYDMIPGVMLRRARESHGITLRDAAKLAGITAVRWGEFERSKRVDAVEMARLMMVIIATDEDAR